MSDTRAEIREILKTLQTKTVLGEQNRAMSYMNLIDEAEKDIMPLLEKKIREARINQLDEFTIRWNNYIGDMPDKEKEKLGYLELTGMVWGIVAQFRIPLEEQLKDSKGKQ